MKTENLVLEKSFRFASRTIKLFIYLTQKKVEKALALQLLQSGTSVGANLEEAMGGSSRKDFLNKLKIAYKEARENRYWLKLLQETKLLEEKMASSFLKDCEEILKILTAILKTAETKEHHIIINAKRPAK